MKWNISVFVFDRFDDKCKGVEVLHFGTGAELALAQLADRKVDVAPQRALVHPAVGYAGVEDNGTELLQVRLGFLGGADVRLRNDLDQRNAATVAVYHGAVYVVVHQLSGVLLNVDPGDADALGACRRLNIQPAVLAKRQVVLGDLICLGQVGIEVVLPVLLGKMGNGAVGGKSRLDGVFHHLSVQGGQGARQTHADRTALRVGGGSEIGGAGAEDLGFGFQLNVDLKTDDHFIILYHHFLLLSYVFSKASAMR